MVKKKKKNDLEENVAKNKEEIIIKDSSDSDRKESLANDKNFPEVETIVEVSKDLDDRDVEVEQERKIIDEGQIEIKTTISTKNYEDTVVKLINEVKIFNDDAGDLGFQHKRRFWPIILVLIVLSGVAFGIYYCIHIDDEENEVEKEPVNEVIEKGNVLYRYEETESGIDFYADNKLVSSYDCDECSAYSLGTYEYFSTEPTVLAIKEGKSIFLYDYVLSEVISDKYTQLQNLKQGEDTVAFIATNKSGLSGVIDIHGNVIIPLEYELLGYSTNSGDVSDYSYSNDIITAKKDGYWGIINFKGEQIVPFEYEDIYYNGYGAISVYTEGLWYLNDLSNKRLIETGYDIIIPIKSYVFASVNNIFYILNYNGESIISKEIPTYLNSFRSRENFMTPTFKIEEDGTIVKIYIMSSEKTYDEYKFNTVNGELTEIIQ